MTNDNPFHSDPSGESPPIVHSAGPSRSGCSEVLREIQRIEEQKAHNDQLTREVKEFFEDATRTAAIMLSQLPETNEEQSDSAPNSDMSEFLNTTFNRFKSFVTVMESQGSADSTFHVIEENAQDYGESSGTGLLSETPMPRDEPNQRVPGKNKPLEFNPALAGTSRAKPYVEQLVTWFGRLSNHDEDLREVLSLLVKGGFMERQEARALWAQTRHRKG